MKAIAEDIKNQNFKKIYLLYGEEGYLKKQYRDRLLKALMPEEDTMNTSFYEGKNLDPGQLIDLAETIPFFAERRVMVLQNTGFFKNKCQELADYLGGELPDYLCVIFVEEEVDKRGRMYKAVKSNGHAADFSRQDTKTLTRWVLGKINQEGKKITRGDMELFLTMTGDDMENIDSELEKLFSYTLGKEVITGKDIEEICTPQLTNKIFDMVRAVTEKNQEKALELYYDLLALKEPPMRILFLLARQFNQMLQIKELAALGHSQSDIGKRLGIPPFAVKNVANCARAYTCQQLKETLEDCVDAEEAVKTGRLGDVLSLELLIVKYSSK